MGTPGIVLVLGAGGARGIALAGVLRRLQAEGIPIDAILGCSVGAIVATMYTAVGMTPGEMVEASRSLGGPSLLSYALSRWRLPLISRAALRGAGTIPGHLRRLQSASLQVLRHGVRRLGILTYDLKAREELLWFGGPGLPLPIPLAKAVTASAAIPGLFPPVRASLGRRRLLLADAGLSTAVPIERAFALPVGAQRVIAVSLSLRVCLRQSRRTYWDHLQAACGDRLLVVRPNVRGRGTIIVPRGSGVDALAAAGEEAVDATALSVIRSWLRSESSESPAFLDTPGTGC